MPNCLSDSNHFSTNNLHSRIRSVISRSNVKNERLFSGTFDQLFVHSGRCLLATVVCSSFAVLAQTPVNSVPGTSTNGNKLPVIHVADERVEVLERGPHHNRIRYTRKVADTNGLWREVTSSYTQLENGLNRKDAQGNWAPAPAVLEITPDGAQFVGGEWVAQFRAAPDAVDAVSLTTGSGPNARAYISHVVGLAYFDKASGDSVLLAEVSTNSAPGVLTTDHDLVYPSCFVGIDGDIVYHLSRSSLGQDIRLRSTLPTPDSFQLDPATTELEVLTEFVQSDTPRILSGPQIGSPGAPSGTLVGDDLGDREINFGLFNIGMGHAFAASGGTNDPSDGGGELVRKHWAQLSGRQVLIEALDFQKAAGWLDSLPAPTGGGSLKSRPVLRREVQNRPMPPRPKRFDQAEYGNRGRMRKVIALKDAPVEGPALVLDYQSLVGTTYSSYTFAANETYYISGQAIVSGTITYEGGTVLKMAPMSSNAGVTLQTGSAASVICQSGIFRPVIITAVDDRSVGADLPGANSAYLWTRYYGNPALGFDASSSVQGLALRCFQIRFANLGLSFKANGSSGSGHSLWHAQFEGCNTAIHVDNSTKLVLRNALFCSTGLKTFDLGTSATLDAQNVTVDLVPTVVVGGTLNLTNSILSGYTTRASGASYNAGYVSDTAGGYGGFAPGVYGSAGHYLQPGTLQNSGSPSSDPMLLADLKARTTQPPGSMDSSTATLPAPVVRDVWGTNLGYHYDPEDAQAQDVSITGGLNYVLPPGYVIGLLDAGISVDTGSLTTTAGPGSRVWLVRNELVEEYPYPVSVGYGLASLVYGTTATGTAPTLNLRFCNFAVFAGCKALDIGPGVGSVNLSDCEFYAGTLTDTAGPSGTSGTGSRSEILRNDLFVRTAVTLQPGTGVTLTVTGKNNTFAGSAIALSLPGADTWMFRNNLFERCVITPGPYEFTASNNGYVTNSTTTTTLNPVGLSDVVMNSLNYNKGTLGYYYLDPTSALIDAGDGTADSEGFYFYTTATAQTLEGQSRIDIGYHYPALDGSGLPYSSGGGPGVVNDPNGSAYLNANAYAGGNGPSQGFNVVITKPVNGQNHP